MNPPKHPEETLFEAARKLTKPEAVRAFLDAACAGDADLRRRVEELLNADAEAEAFFAGQNAPTVHSPAAPAYATPRAPLHLAPGPEQPGTVIDRYKLLQKIGEGGCGVVYMAEQSEPVKRRVALKVIKLGMDTKSVIARFEAERQALAMMDHSNIAKVLDAGATETGRPYFVMELVRGMKITEYCDETKLSTPQRLDLFIQVCQAVQHAHQKGIIHRDIKPSNILVTVNDGVPVPKVIDFGIAKATNQQQLTDKTLFTAFEQFIGTPAYMSPEQALMTSLDIDTRSDIYSLGVLLYEMLTGKTPLDAKELLALGLDEMRRTIREKEPMRPSTRLSTMVEGDLTSTAKLRQVEVPKLIHQLRGDLDWIVMKALEKDRARRYETANGFAMDIQRHLNNEPVVARPPSPAYRFQKLVRRNKLAFAAATVVVSVLVLGITISTWQAIRATNAQQAALAAEATEKMQRRIAEDAQAAEKEQRLVAQQKQQEAEAERQRAETSDRVSQRLLYGANMNLAQQAWEQKSVELVRELLEETATVPERGFEWYFWQRQTHLSLEVKTMHGHGGQVLAVAFSPDGQRIVTGSADQTAKVWDTASGKELFSLRGHNRAINSVAFSPDGRRILTGSEDQTANLWDAATGNSLLSLKGHSNQIMSVAFSPDGQQVVTGSLDRTAKVWEAATGKHLLDLTGHTYRINFVIFFPDGQRIVTGSGDQTAKVWEARNGKHLSSFKGHGNEIHSIAISPDSQRMVTGSYDNTAMVWNTGSGEWLFTLKGHSAGVYSVAFSPDGRRIVTGSGDQKAKLWDAATFKELLFLKGHSGPVRSVAFSRDGQRIVTGSEDTTAKVWEAASVEQVSNWRQEAQAALELLATQKRKRAEAAERDRVRRVQDPGAIKQWLVLLPIPYEGRNDARALQEEQVAPESQLHPGTGAQIKAGQKDLIWRAVQLEDYLIDFNRLAGAEMEWSVAYAVAYIQSEAYQSAVLLKVRSDDGARVYLNGKLIHERVTYRADHEDVVAGVEVKAGINTLVFKVVNGSRAWEGSVWLTDKDGNALKGIKVTLTP